MGFNLLDVFGDENEYHKCCSCCPGDHVGLSEPRPPALFLFENGGTMMVTDRYVAIRADLLNPWLRKLARVEVSNPLFAPDSDHPSTARFTPEFVARLTALGVEIRQGEGNLTAQPLYFEGEKVGMVMPRKPKGDAGPDDPDLLGMTLDETEKVAKIARRLGQGASEMHPWTFAAYALHVVEGVL